MTLIVLLINHLSLVVKEGGGQHIISLVRKGNAIGLYLFMLV